MRPAADVLVIGDALLDVHVIPSRPPRSGGDVPAEIRLEPGGQGANVAVRLARQGHRVRLVCALGHDAAADLLRERLAVDGVELIEVAAATTGAVVVLLDAARERTMLSQRVALGRGAMSVALPDAAWLVVSGYVLLEADADPAGLAGSPRRALVGCALEPGDVASWLGRARSLAPHVVVLNLDEARVLQGAFLAPVALATELAKLLDTTIVVTHPDGATGALNADVVEVASRAEGAVVDATGSGDAFAAGLIGALADGAWPPTGTALERAMTTAVELASAVSRVPGAQTRVAVEGKA